MRSILVPDIGHPPGGEPDRESSAVHETEISAACLSDDSRRADFLELIENEESKEVLMETIDGLPEQQRLVVALYYYEEMTLKEIGEALHISESRVSQIHTRAVKTLKARLARIV